MGIKSAIIFGQTARPPHARVERPVIWLGVGVAVLFAVNLINLAAGKPWTSPDSVDTLMRRITGIGGADETEVFGGVQAGGGPAGF